MNRRADPLEQHLRNVMETQSEQRLKILTLSYILYLLLVILLTYFFPALIFLLPFLLFVSLLRHTNTCTHISDATMSTSMLSSFSSSLSVPDPATLVSKKAIYSVVCQEVSGGSKSQGGW